MDFAGHEFHEVQQKNLGKEWTVGHSSEKLGSDEVMHCSMNPDDKR